MDIWQAAWMGREFLPRTEPYRQTKLYAKWLSFDDSGPDRNNKYYTRMDKRVTNSIFNYKLIHDFSLFLLERLQYKFNMYTYFCEK